MPSYLSLDQLKIGQYGTIQHIHAEPTVALRLNAMGFRLGKRVELIRVAPFNGPMQIRIGSTDIIIRSCDARHIELMTSQP